MIKYRSDRTNLWIILKSFYDQYCLFYWNILSTPLKTNLSYLHSEVGPEFLFLNHTLLSFSAKSKSVIIRQYDSDSNSFMNLIDEIKVEAKEEIQKIYVKNTELFVEDVSSRVIKMPYLHLLKYLKESESTTILSFEKNLDISFYFKIIFGCIGCCLLGAFTLYKCFYEKHERTKIKPRRQNRDKVAFAFYKDHKKKATNYEEEKALQNSENSSSSEEYDGYEMIMFKNNYKDSNIGNEKEELKQGLVSKNTVSILDDNNFGAQNLTNEFIEKEYGKILEASYLNKDEVPYNKMQSPQLKTSGTQTSDDDEIKIDIPDCELCID